MRAITAAGLCTPLEYIHDPVLLIDNGIITAMGPSGAVAIPPSIPVHSFPEAVLVPGFVDMHIHGAAGYDVMEATPKTLNAIERFLAAHGVTGYCPTTITAPVDLTLSVLDQLADWIERRGKNREPQAVPLGIHMEGPFLSHEKRGVQPEKYLLDASVGLFRRFWDAARGHLLVITIAPEIPGALEVIREAAKLGVTVSLGHSDATSEITNAAIVAGARHATHTFNGMRPLNHRDPGILGTVLTSDVLTAEIIADGVHVIPSIVSLFVRAKGVERTVLVTDAIAATGMPDGSYKLGTLEVQVQRSVCLSRDGHLAGSVLTLDRAIRNVMEFTGCALREAVRFVTLNPARVLGCGARKGSLQIGADADVAVMAPNGDVIHTMIRGVEIEAIAMIRQRRSEQS
ncbi:MAG TPA: N-acetylglucosamine-6-phosphate deacetylase [Dongiaceae bacterium]|nr:N-acetylglucosamine-6-phosphate deacetylase [Dongiaceae bacterium]